MIQFNSSVSGWPAGNPTPASLAPNYRSRRIWRMPRRNWRARGPRRLGGAQRSELALLCTGAKLGRGRHQLSRLSVARGARVARPAATTTRRCPAGEPRTFGLRGPSSSGRCNKSRIRTQLGSKSGPVYAVILSDLPEAGPLLLLFLQLTSSRYLYTSCACTSSFRWALLASMFS